MQKQGLLHLKSVFSLNHQCLLWSPKSSLTVPWRSWTLGHLGGFQGMSPERRVPAVFTLVFFKAASHANPGAEIK